MIASRGRSGWLVLGIYFMLSLVLQRNIKSLVLGTLLVVSVFIVLESNLKVGDGTVEDVLLYRSINTHKDLGRTAFDIFDEEEKNWIERIDDNRWFIYQSAIEHLLDNPQYLLIGAGFQNAGVAIGKVAIAAHNAYLNVIAEHGLFGFFVYFSFLYFLFTLAWKVRKRSNTKLSRVMATNWIALYAGLLAANFFGEIIYPGRALFTFLGTFFIVAVLFLHPAWRNASKT
jgi:O-antigen ligase